MKALILNSGRGTRIGAESAGHPKCMTVLSGEETIVSRQLKLLAGAGINDIIMTTGLFHEKLSAYCDALHLPVRIRYVYNPAYASTNYIASIHEAYAFLDDDILMMHGDLVWEEGVLPMLLDAGESAVTISSTLPVTEKDFKALLREDGYVDKIGVEYVHDSVCLQPLYALKRRDWKVWLSAIRTYCEAGKTGVYAETALSEVRERCRILPLDVKDMLCAEIDDTDDLEAVRKQLGTV